MFSDETRDGPWNIPTPAARVEPLLEVAQKYVHACDHFDRTLAEYHKINEELKSVDMARKELRQQLMSMIDQAVEEKPVNKARQW